MTHNREFERWIRQVLLSGVHVYCQRKNGLYDHHGVVFRDGDRLLVYHVRKDRCCADLCSGCTGIQQPESGPIISCLECFSRQEQIYIIKYRKRVSQKNLDREIAQKKVHPRKVIQGYCSEQLYLEYHSLSGAVYCHTKISSQEDWIYRSLLDNIYRLSEFSSCKSADEVVATARGVGRPGVGTYNLVLSNCEDFVVGCQTNNPRSIQVARRFGAVPFAGRGLYRALKFGHSTGGQICKRLTDIFTLRVLGIQPVSSDNSFSDE